MNQDQVAAILRTLLQGLGAGLITKGVLSPSELGSAVDIIAGGLTFFGFLAWGVWARSNKNLVASAQAVHVSKARAQALEDKKAKLGL